MNQTDIEIRQRQAKYLKDKYLEKIINDDNPGMSQNDFAAWLDLSPNTLSRAISGKTQLSLENCITASKQLGPGIFEACGYPRIELADPKYQKLTDRLRARWDSYSDERKDVITENINEIMDKIDEIDQPTSALRPAASSAFATVPA